MAIAAKKCPDERFRPKFIELAQRLFKTGSCKQSLDWVGQSDYEQLAHVMGECDLVSVIHLLSDKCGEKELEKLASDYEKDLKACV